MKKLVVCLIFIASCNGKPGDIDIADLEWGLNESEISERVPVPGDVTYLEENGIIRTLTYGKGLNDIIFLKYPVSTEVKKEYRVFIEMYKKMEAKYGKPIESELIDPSESLLVEMITKYNIEYFATWETRESLIQIKFTLVEGENMPMVIVRFQRK